MENDASPAAQTIVVREVPIELCQLLKFAGVTASGGEAKQVISEGLVTVNGEPETRKRRKLAAGDRVAFQEHTLVVQTG